jgi:hypothetical protein
VATLRVACRPAAISAPAEACTGHDHLLQPGAAAGLELRRTVTFMTLEIGLAPELCI